MSNQLTIRDHLDSETFQREIRRSLPKHVDADRMARVAINAIMRTPDLAKADQASFFNAMMDLSKWGLEPDGYHAHLIPFKNRKRNCVEVQLILDYKGIVELAYRSGIVKSITAEVVYDGDDFEYDRGEVVRHTPHFLRPDRPDPGLVVAVYAICRLKGGAEKTELMSTAEVEKIRARSRAGKSGPWVTDWTEMAKKTVFRRLSKWLPLSAEIREAFDREDAGDVKTAPTPAIEPRNLQGEDLAAAMISATQPASYSAPDEALGYDAAIEDATDREAVLEIVGAVDASDLPPSEKADIARHATERLNELDNEAEIE